MGCLMTAFVAINRGGKNNASRRSYEGELSRSVSAETKTKKKIGDKVKYQSASFGRYDARADKC